MYFHCCENRDSNSSAVSLQGYSKEAPSGAGMDSLSLIRVSNSGKGSDRSVSFMGSALAPEQLASP